MERGGWKPHVEICPACPRCGSSNTKFCYYNNYSLTQPRYFCKGCRRYWTKGGSLRNVPVGGGCRKTRRGKAVRMARQGVSSRVVTSGDHRCPSNGHNNSYRADDSSSTNPSSSNIDLAVVYANFLNQQPQPPQEISANDHIIMNPMPDISNHPVFDFSLNLGVEFFGTATHDENCWSTMDTDHSKDLMYICGLELVGHQKQQTTHPTSIIAKDQQIISDYDELPPLPGEEVAAQGMVINNLNQISNSMQLLGFEKDLDLSRRDEFMGNSSSMFEDLPTYGTTHSFSSNP